MSDNATTGGTYTFATFNDGTAHHPGNVLEFVTGGSAGAWTTQKVDSTHGLPVAGVGTFAISAASLPLPAGAATAAKQPSLGTAGSASTDVLTVQGIASGVAQPVSAASLPLPTGASTEATLSTLNGKVTACNTGAVVVSAALPAGTNTVGNVGRVATTTGGLSMSRTLSAATTNATNVKASAGQVYGIFATNTNASPRFIKFYDSASAPTAGSGTPVLTLMVPGNASGAGLSIQQPVGITFASGIGFTITASVADNDTTTVAASEVILNVLYK